MLRRPRLLVPAVLAAGLLISGCSEEVSGTGSPASGTTSSSSSSSAGPDSEPSTSAGGGSGEHQEFCTAGEEVFGEVEEAFEAVGDTDVAGLVSALQQAVDAFDQLEPPEEIADDWAAARDGLAELRDAVAAIDPAAPDAADQALDILSQAEATIGPAFERVGAWTDANCA